jgi:hypothetical protein
MNPLQAYLAEVSAQLPGPRRARQRILAELGDGIEQATADRTAAGQDPQQAITATIEEFGHPRAVATAFTGELTIAYARRALGWLLATGPLVGTWWLLLSHPFGIAAIPVMPLIAAAVITALLAAAGTGRFMRWLPETRPRQALAAVIAVAALALLADAIMITAYLRSGVAVRLLAVVAIVASLIRGAGSLAAIEHAKRRWRRLDS